ncbi:MAG: cytochrome P450 [Deltaproteobacteria bacterium]|nr:cytochrome P450 [Myxococcales bacterium]MDP3220015.1 cytochrome P450 [Deltaproteobacteria bacterium]
METAAPLAPLTGPTPGGRWTSLMQQAPFLLDPLGAVAGRFARFGDLYRVQTRDGALFVLRHPDHLRDVLVTHAAKYTKTHSAFRQLARVLGDGLLTSDGAAWQRQRRMVQPAFSRARMESYADAMVAEAARTVGGWRDGEARDVSVDMMELTLRVVGRTLFGHDASGDVGDVAAAMRDFQEIVSRPDLLPAWVPSPSRRRLARAVATLDRIIHDMIAKRQGGAAGDDLLQMLVDATDAEGDGGRMSLQEVRDQLVTLFLAGHETTSHALTWTLYLLSQNPGAEAALHAELDAVLGDRLPTLADLDAMPYTEQVIKESMRLYPPVYMVARQAAEDTEIGGHPVPKGSEVVLWIYMTHRDPRWFPDHAAFRPERFAPEAEAALPRLAWLPFGAGPRACIGRGFAMMEAKLLLAVMARRHRLSLVPGHRVEVLPRVTLMPKHGMRMTVHARPRG